MDSNLMTQLMVTTPATGLSAYVAAAQSCTAPKTAAHGTRVSFAGTSAAVAGTAQAAPFSTVGVRNIDLPGSHPRGAPV